MVRQGSLDSNLFMNSWSLTTIDLPGVKDAVLLNIAHKRLTSYLSYMAHVVPADSIKRLKSGMHIPVDQLTLLNQDLCDDSIMFVNCVIGRIFWDFLHQEYWANKMREKIQRKLSKIHVSEGGWVCVIWVDGWVCVR